MGEHSQRGQPPAAVWDDRLITRDRAAGLTGEWPVRVQDQDAAGLFLRCGKGTCDGNILRLPDPGMLISVDGMISAVLRHMVMCHGQSLSGRPS
jgi:hypothetical protein